MLILYRLCSQGNPNKIRPIQPKIKLIEACLRSLERAFVQYSPTIHFIIDKPTTELVELVESIKFDYTIETIQTSTLETGNEATFFKQLEIASKIDDKVMLLEDDYYFVDGGGDILIEALDYLDMVTPYDHPGYYTEEKHNYEKNPKLVAGHIFTPIIDTTLTFAVRNGEEIIGENIEHFTSNSYWDEHMWKNVLANTQYKLWRPMPSLATHMETPHLAPKVKWNFI